MVWVVNAISRALDPRERPGTHCVRGWVGPRAGLENLAPHSGFDPRTVQPVASHNSGFSSVLIKLNLASVELAAVGATWSLLGSPRNGQAMLYPF